MTITIKIRECRIGGQIWGSTTHRTDDADEAIRRSINKHFGKKYGFYIDNGLTDNSADTRYGQIGHYLPSANCSTMDTGRVRIDISR